VLKQLVRDIIQPERDLGHSDRKTHKAVESQENVKVQAVSSTTENTVEEEKTTSGNDAVLQFREVAEQACEDCQ
jgi:hypothetical protein